MAAPSFSQGMVRRQQELRRTLGSRKLLLVLDLDHTLLNSSRDSELLPQQREQLNAMLETQVPPLWGKLYLLRHCVAAPLAGREPESNQQIL